jgi:hypothetical protein
MQRVKLGMDNDQIMIDNRSQRWRAKSCTGSRCIAEDCRASKDGADSCPYGLYEDADVGQLGEK